MNIRRGQAQELIQLADAESGEATLHALPYATTDFDSFYRAEITGLVVLARALAGPAVAEDIAQESMLVVFRKWPEVRDLASPVGWARGVCLHKAVSMVRRRTRERRLLVRFGTFRSAVVDAGEDERFWTAVRSLPLRQAQAVALFYGLDLTVEDVATALGCAEGTVKSHLSRARSALAQSWSLEEESS